jgi:Zinc carboxypeptidase
MSVSVSRSMLMRLPELIELQRLAAHGAKDFVHVEELVTLTHKDLELPLLAFEFGSRDPRAPVFFLTGGVHGLERIGSRVILSYLKTLMNLAHWDPSTRALLERVRLSVIPIVNPVGMYLGRRSNGSGVDLMRNAPIDADKGSIASIAAGHRISSKLPWFRGLETAGMEKESKALTSYFEDRFATAESVIALDVHSGFGAVDRLWFPYARTKEPFPNVHEVYRLINLLDSVYPHHIYKTEPQSASYTTHGDLWDYLYDRRKNAQGSTFIPLTLELGSWSWIKKNPRQLFSALGIFNPLLPHRTSRILRRHLHLLDFLLRAAASPQAWLQGRGMLGDPGEVGRLARARWYQEKAA